MQPSSREMQPMNTLLNQQQQQQEHVAIQDLQNHHHHQIQFDPTSSHDDFLEQMLSSINPSSWPDLSGPATLSSLKSSASVAGGDDQPENAGIQNQQYPFEDQSSALLASKLRHHQINNNGATSAAVAAKALMLEQHLMLSRGLSGNGLRSPTGDNGLLPLPLSLGNVDQNDIADASFKSANPANDSSVQALYNGFARSLGQSAGQPPHFHPSHAGAMQAQNFGGPAASAPSMNQGATPSGSTGAGGGAGTPAQPRQQRVRARRGQATDPHSIAERLRRERIAERMKALQELVPNANKTDKASMLDEIIDYVKFLQLQVKVLSMSRLGGAAAVAPLVADMSSEAGGDGGRNNGTQTASSSNNDGMTVTEHQVAKLMEEDMGSAMQYLQGKGLCLMPISLATAISTATCHSRNPMNPNNLSNHNNNSNHPLLVGSNGTSDVAAATAGGGPSSPSMSVLTVQSATLANGTCDVAVKDSASVSKS